jgi:AcrR family transcriptional regulator
MTAGRANQKERTRTAIVRAAHELMTSGAELSMSLVAARALVSEATAYRYFPDLAALLAEAFTGLWPTPAESLAPMAHVTDPTERIAHATETLLRDVHAYQGAVRAMIAASITRPDADPKRPGRRFGLIDEALAPVAATVDRATFDQLKRDLAIVISAEAFFNLTDFCGLTPEAAIASVIHTARTLTMATIGTTQNAGPAPRG